MFGRFSRFCRGYIEMRRVHGIQAHNSRTQRRLSFKQVVCGSIPILARVGLYVRWAEGFQN